jgi:hypothetical protein
MLYHPGPAVERCRILAQDKRPCRLRDRPTGSSGVRRLHVPHEVGMPKIGLSLVVVSQSTGAVDPPVNHPNVCPATTRPTGAIRAGQRGQRTEDTNPKSCSAIRPHLPRHGHRGRTIFLFSQRAEAHCCDKAGGTSAPSPVHNRSDSLGRFLSKL